MPGRRHQLIFPAAYQLVRIQGANEGTKTSPRTAVPGHVVRRGSSVIVVANCWRRGNSGRPGGRDHRPCRRHRLAASATAAVGGRAYRRRRQ